jgi:hypothetical protein
VKNIILLLITSFFCFLTGCGGQGATTPSSSGGQTYDTSTPSLQSVAFATDTSRSVTVDTNTYSSSTSPTFKATFSKPVKNVTTSTVYVYPESLDAPLAITTPAAGFDNSYTFQLSSPSDTISSTSKYYVFFTAGITDLAGRALQTNSYVQTPQVTGTITFFRAFPLPYLLTLRTLRAPPPRLNRLWFL